MIFLEFLLFYLYSFFDKDISEKHDSKTDDVENVDGFSPVKVLKTYQRRRRSPKHTIGQGIVYRNRIKNNKDF